MTLRGIYFIILFHCYCITSYSQQIYVWDDNWGFGIADLSTCTITKKYVTAPSFPGGTLNVFLVPDGRLYRSIEIDGGFLSATEPITWTQIKKSYDNPPRNLGDIAIAIGSNSRSNLIIDMFDKVLNQSYLMSYDYSNAKFIILGALGNIGHLRSLVCLGNKVLAIEERLTPYRYYNLLELNLNDLSNNKVLFSIDSSYWVKDYTPNYISPSLRLFKSFNSCDSVGIYLTSLANNDSISHFYRVDFQNKTLKFICSINSLQRLRGADGLTSFDFLKKCKLDVDLDLNNSADSLKNYRVLYSCPQAEQKIHDFDWEYYSDGPIDSIRIEIISPNLDATSEYLLAKYQPLGLTIIGNATSKLQLIPSKKFYTSEIQKILDGIIYYNDKLVPSIGTRDIRISIDIPWFQDTVYCRIIVPKFADAGRDTLITLCPDMSVHQLESYLEDGGASKGMWLEPEVAEGTFIAGFTPEGNYHFILNRGLCFSDTAIISIHYYNDIELELGKDTLVEEYTFHYLNARGKFTGNEFFNWYKEDTILANHNSSISFNIENDTRYSIEVTSDDGCIFKDSILIRVKRYEDLWVPNVFSPNGDQVNDIFFFKSKYSFQLIKLSIYDRWGNLIFFNNNFQSNDELFGWNGEINQQKATPGIYIYYLEYVGNGGQIVKKVGDICLIR